MKLKQFDFLIAAFLPATAIGASERLSIDVIVANPDGSVSVDRTSSWPDFNGGIVDVTQRLKQDDFGRLSYRYEDQSRATQLYHQAYCESVGNDTLKRDHDVVGSLHRLVLLQR